VNIHGRTVRNRRTLLIVAATGLAAATLAATAATAGAAPHTAGTKYPTVQNIGPRYTVAGGAAVLPTTQTVPHWHSSFVDGLNHQTYGFNMVGADPSNDTSTTVPTVIIPLSFTFAADNGQGFSGGTVASDAAKSPIYTPTAMPTTACGETEQYLDAVMRCEFGKAGTSSGYGVQLTETMLPAQTINVPRDHGAIYNVTDQNGNVVATVGLVDYAWFSAALQSILASANIPTTTLPVVISNNVYLYIKSVANCCVIGFHGAAHVTGLGGGGVHGNGNQGVQTFAWATWIPTAALFGSGLTDVAALSHEISEWGHDPFTDNFVNNWEVAGEPQYGCSNILETGDPLVGVDFPVGSSNPDLGTGPAWHLQDEAFLWWFSRDPLTAPTPASNGAYSFNQTFTTPAGTC
jgi:hypothetical protein